MTRVEHAPNAAYECGACGLQWYDGIQQDCGNHKNERADCKPSPCRAVLKSSPAFYVADKFPIGARVRKINGYRFEGYVLGTFVKCDGVTKFLNVENDDGWVMHFREDQLELIGPSSRSDSAHHVDDPLVQGSDGTGVGASSLPTVSPAPGEDVIAFSDAAVNWLHELPDRSSPDDWLEACLVTGDELHAYLIEHLTDALSAAEARGRDAERGRAAKCVPTNWTDNLLTGADGIGGPPYDCRTIEKLLRGIQDAIRAGE